MSEAKSLEVKLLQGNRGKRVLNLKRTIGLTVAEPPRPKFLNRDARDRRRNSWRFYSRRKS